MLGEGPTWDAAEGTLWWVDILGQRLHRWDGIEARVMDLPFTPSLAAPRGDGTLTMVTDKGLIPFDPVSGGQLAALPIEPDRPGNRSNDSKVSPGGRLLVGTMGRAFERKAGAIHAIDKEGVVTRLVDGLTIPNGLAWSPDGKWLHYADSALQTVYRAPWNEAEGIVGEPEPFLQPAWPAAPDGAAMAADGIYWVALWDGSKVAGVAPDGKVVAEIALPVQRPTACAFGGADLKTLFITSAADGDSSRHAGALFAVAMPGPGTKIPPFAWGLPSL
jgi:sugar lactone lactonase YvrE